jgi:hypothetical protein
MITAVVAKNFKGIGEEPFRLPIRPITLIFGPNCAGKSTLIQALHYAREVIERHNLDARTTISGGQFVDLGGFRNFVHKRDIRKEVTLRFEMKLPDRRPMSPLPNFDWWIAQIKDAEAKQLVEYKLPEATHAAVEFSIALCERGPYVSNYLADLNGERIGEIKCNPIDKEYDPRDGQTGSLKVNFEHPIFEPIMEALFRIDERYDGERAERNPVLGLEPDRFRRLIEGIGTLTVGSQPDALPDLKDGLDVFYEGFESDNPLGDGVMSGLLSRLIAGPMVLLRKELAGLRYLGPLREAPPRGYSPPPTPEPLHALQPPPRSMAEPSRWATGLGAWDALYANESLVSDVSRWLSDEDRLATGYEVLLRRYNELKFEDELYSRIMSCEAAKDPERLKRDVEELRPERRITLRKAAGEGDVLPQAVGVGMSQLFPVVVACLDPGPRLTCIEQPELHLHPRLQCELGDLLIRGALGELENVPPWERNAEPGEQRRVERTFIVETHSEHLILRILRRIRETTRIRETNVGAPDGHIPITPDDLSVCYVSQEDREDGQDRQSVPRTIHVDDQGEFIEPWPDQFFEQDFYERFS